MTSQGEVIKSFNTRVATPKLVPSAGARLRGLVPEQHRSQKRRKGDEPLAALCPI